MRIRILKAFSGYRIGQEFDWSDGMARIYIGRGMAEEIGEAVEQRAVEEAQVEARVERATMPHRRKPK